MDVKFLSKALFSNIDPNAVASKECPMGENSNCSRHQLIIQITPTPAAGTVKVRGIGWGSKLAPAAFDSRLDGISMATLGTQAYIFYGLFDGLSFAFSGFAAGSKLAAHIVSHTADLTISGNAA